MKSEFWHDRWLNSQIGFHQSEVNSYLQEHWSEHFQDRGTVFVPLCGKSRDMIWLCDQGHTVIGSELSAIAARDFFDENGLVAHIEKRERYQYWHDDDITLLVGDFFELTAEDLEGVTTVYDRAALVALPPEMRQQYIDHLKAILPPDCKLLLIATTYPQEEMDGPPFSVELDEIKALYQPQWQVEQLFTHDFPNSHPRLINRGISRMEESVYLIK